MNRFRLVVLAGVVAVVAGLSASPAGAQAPTVRAPVAPAPVVRYYYGLGYYGYGYYPYTVAPGAPINTPGYYTVPVQPRTVRSTNYSPSTYHEWGTGRNVYLAKPWMRPIY